MAEKNAGPPTFSSTIPFSTDIPASGATSPRRRRPSARWPTSWPPRSTRTWEPPPCRRSHRPFMVVGTAGTVSTGVTDPLPAIAAVCRRHDLWFHADGAYGAPAAVLPDASPDLLGLREADSLAPDPHKWLHSPLEAGCALVRDSQEPELQAMTRHLSIVTFRLVPADLRDDLSSPYRRLSTRRCSRDCRRVVRPSCRTR